MQPAEHAPADAESAEKQAPASGSSPLAGDGVGGPSATGTAIAGAGPAPPPTTSAVAVSAAAGSQRVGVPGSGQATVAALRRPLESVGQAHMASLVAQLLLAEGILDVHSWCPVITSLACEAAATIQPSAMVAFGNNDPRFYVKVRCAGGFQSLKSKVFKGLGSGFLQVHSSPPDLKLQEEICIV